jgi:hypothetical protein
MKGIGGGTNKLSTIVLRYGRNEGILITEQPKKQTKIILQPTAI